MADNKGLELLTNWCKKSGLSCSFFIFAALNIAMVVIGADALNLCIVEPMIPIYLIGKFNYHPDCTTSARAEFSNRSRSPV